MGLADYILLKDTRNAVLRASVGNSLQLWLDASDSTTITESSGSVSQWDDKSGNGNDVTQGTGSAQPTTNSNILNGKNVLAFDGTDKLVIPSGVYSTLFSGDNTTFIVAESSTLVQKRLLVATTAGSTRFNIVTGASGTNFTFVHNDSFDGTPFGTIDVTDPNIIMVRREGTTQAISVNGAAEITEAAAVDLTSITDFTLGAHASGTDEWEGDIAEVIIYNRSLSSTEITDINRYLATKWNLSISAPDNIGGLQLWLDANDSSTITESGGKISQWDDKSTSGNNATQGTGANQPIILTGEIRGKKAVSFVGAAPPFMTLDSTINGTNLTVFAAFVSTAGNGQGTILGDSGGNERIMAYDPDIGGNGALVTRDGTTQVLFSLTSSFRDIPVLLMNIFEVGVGQKLHFNGDLKETGAYDGTIMSDQVGRLGTTGIQVGGNLGELLVYDRILSASEITSVNTYLSNKWGITLA